MFTGKILVSRLTHNKITPQAVSDINGLLRKQRHDARPIDQESLNLSLKKMAVVAAWNDAECIVGIGALIWSEGLNFTCAEIRHLIVADGLDILAIGMRIIQKLLNGIPPQVTFIDAGAWLQDDDVKAIFVACGFKEKQSSRFRLRLEEK